MSDQIGRKIARPASKSEDMAETVSTPVFQTRWPELFRFLEKGASDGRPFTTGCLTIFYEDGVFKVSVNDRLRSRSTFVSGKQLPECLAIADRGLRAGSLKWRPYGPNKQFTPQPTLNLA